MLYECEFCNITMKGETALVTYSIIKLQPEDYYKCGNIWDMNRNFKNSKKWYEELVKGTRIIFVYIENGQFLGEGALVLHNSDPDYTIAGKRVYLSRMIVKTEYRNRGIGSIILDFLIDYAKTLGFEEISVGVDIDNIVARHLYEKKGFTNIIFEGEDELGKYIKILKKI